MNPATETTIERLQKHRTALITAAVTEELDVRERPDPSCDSYLMAI
jgi:hypothetical protein